MFKEATMGVPGLESSMVFAGISFGIGGEKLLARGILSGKSVVLPGGRCSSFHGGSLSHITVGGI